MRLLAILVIFAAISFTPAGASAPGAYASPAAESSNDCVRLCQDDSLCVGWTYESGACGLWASVPKDAPFHFMLSNHAPGFARQVEIAEATHTPAAPPERPSPAPHEAAAVALLGGYDGDDDLRPRLGGN